MPLIRLLLLSLGLALSLPASARPGLFSPAQGIADEGLLSVDEALQLLPATRRQQELTLEWNIAPGYYLYRNQLRFEVLSPPGFRLAPPLLPAGEITMDAEFGRVEVYRGILGARFVLPPGLKGPLKLRVGYQGCADIGICYPPQTRTVLIPAAAKP